MANFIFFLITFYLLGLVAGGYITADQEVVDVLQGKSAMYKWRLRTEANESLEELSVSVPLINILIWDRRNGFVFTNASEAHQILQAKFSNNLTEFIVIITPSESDLYECRVRFQNGDNNIVTTARATIISNSICKWACNFS